MKRKVIRIEKESGESSELDFNQALQILCLHYSKFTIILYDICIKNHFKKYLLSGKSMETTKAIYKLK